ncbi:universal stress protein [Henriciella mobilis]|uniref:Universal stress protein n=1 Tax=Henriciella mobilis TaxID=2305467 RepID=A0A399RDB3_9PROT|nr:universal stress protein [Henriciella mobilis]RIJ15639.1 universal stress protein [Henriciella mobilis]RIJ19103.1 universal stress protein [Henriciella mobilis]RIJ27905.1 universal stress protein [Henriciella mobilis]
MALEFKKVVAVVDVDDDLADLVFETAKGITASDGELHAIDSNPFITTFESPYASGALEADAEAHRADAERRTKMLDDLAAAHGGATKLAVLEGNPSRDAASYAKKNDADLIVIGSHQKGWLKRLLEGSESADMIREAPCAVFVVTTAHKKKVSG